MTPDEIADIRRSTKAGHGNGGGTAEWNARWLAHLDTLTGHFDLTVTLLSESEAHIDALTAAVREAIDALHGESDVRKADTILHAILNGGEPHDA